MQHKKIQDETTLVSIVDSISSKVNNAINAKKNSWKIALKHFTIFFDLFCCKSLKFLQLLVYISVCYALDKR